MPTRISNGTQNGHALFVNFSKRYPIRTKCSYFATFEIGTRVTPQIGLNAKRELHARFGKLVFGMGLSRGPGQDSRIVLALDDKSEHPTSRASDSEVRAAV
jgi:hypothetical protein